MKTQTSNAVIPVLLSTIATKTYTFREITEPAEMEKLFRLRYQVYSECELALFLKPNKYRLDMDVYDLHSRFFGVYLGNELIGGIRTVLDRKDYYSPEVYKIGNKSDLYNADLSSHDKLVNADYPAFPFISYPEIPEEVKLFYKTHSQDKKIFEASRSFITFGHRNLKLAQLLYESTIVIGLLFCKQTVGLAAIDCKVIKSNFFGRYGFFPVDNLPKFRVNKIAATNMAMFLSSNLSMSSLPQYLHPKFEAMIEEYNRTKMIIQKIQ